MVTQTVANAICTEIKLSEQDHYIYALIQLYIVQEADVPMIIILLLY